MSSLASKQSLMATRYYPLSFSITLLINQGAGINVTDTWTSTQRGPLLSVVTLFFRGSTAKINLWDKLCLDFVFSFTSRRTAVDTARPRKNVFRDFSARHSRLLCSRSPSKCCNSWREGRLSNGRLRMFLWFLVDAFHWNS